VQRRRFLEAVVGVLTATQAAAGKARLEGDTAASQAHPTTDIPTWKAARRFARTPFGNIAYVERGSGKAALFLHGFPLNGFQWRGQLDRLADYRRCIAPDLMGLGYSKIPSGQSLAPPAQLAMLAALLDSLSVTSVDLVANDSGGGLAQLFMTRYPQRVRTVLLTNCDVEPDSPPAPLVSAIELARAGRMADEQFVHWDADKAFARSAKELIGVTFTYPERITDETIDYYLGPLVESAQRKAQVNAYCVGLSPNPLAGIEAALRRSTIPTRILWGTGDTVFSSADPDYLNRILPESRGIRRVEGARLFWPEEFPDLIAQEARALWG
jgi:haloalkane dehalogenase